MPSCAVCHEKQATIYCMNDDANLCASCDIKFHSNPLSARHERRPLTGCHAECNSALSAPTNSWEDAGVVPQAAAGTLFDDLFAMPDAIVDNELDSFLGGLDALPSANDLLNFDFNEGVVPSLSSDAAVPQQEDPLAHLAPISFAAPVQPFIHNAVDEPAMMVPQMEFIKAEIPQSDDLPRRSCKRYVDFMDEEEDSDADMEDSDDGDFILAPRRSNASRYRREAMITASAPIPEPELSRAERVARYREKRARRNFKKTIRYQSRKAYAEIRPRIKGRFVSPEEYAAYMKTQQEAEAVVPVC